MIVEKNEVRKEYIKPQLTVVELNEAQPLLCASEPCDDPTAGGDTVWDEE